MSVLEAFRKHAYMENSQPGKITVENSNLSHDHTSAKKSYKFVQLRTVIDIFLSCHLQALTPPDILVSQEKH